MATPITTNNPQPKEAIVPTPIAAVAAVIFYCHQWRGTTTNAHGETVATWTYSVHTRPAGSTFPCDESVELGRWTYTPSEDMCLTGRVHDEIILACGAEALIKHHGAKSVVRSYGYDHDAPELVANGGGWTVTFHDGNVDFVGDYFVWNLGLEALGRPTIGPKAFRALAVDAEPTPGVVNVEQLLLKMAA